MKLFLAVLFFVCGPSFALNGSCGSDLDARGLIQEWTESGRDLRSADEYEFQMGASSVRVPLFFPVRSAIDNPLLSKLREVSRSLYWRSGRDVRLENGMTAYDWGRGVFSRFPFAKSVHFREALRQAFSEEFRMIENGIARPIIQVVYSKSFNLDAYNRNLLHTQPSVFGKFLAGEAEPLAVIFWGSEFLPQGDPAAVSMFDSVVQIQHDFILRRHLFPVAPTDMQGSVYPTAQTVITRRDLRVN